MAMIKFCILTLFLISNFNLISPVASVSYPQCDIENEVTDPERGYDRISNKGLRALYDTAFFFIDDIVHNSDLRYMEENGVDFSDPDSISSSFENDYETWLYYWVGYVVLAVIGVVIILSVTIGGFVTCCCRCCCKGCGSEQRPEKKGDGTSRLCCGISLFVIMTLCMFGGVCVILTTADLMEKIDARKENSIYHNYAQAFDQLNDYLTDSVEEINCTGLSSFRATKESVFQTLDNAPNDSVQILDNEMLATETLTTLRTFTILLPTLKTNLDDCDSNLTQLTTFTTDLETQLEDAETAALNSLSSCTDQACRNMETRLQDLAINVDYTSFNFVPASTATDNLIDGDVDGNVVAGLQEIDNTRQDVSNEMGPSIDDAKMEMDNIDSQIGEFMDDLDSWLVSADLTDLSESMRNLQDDIPGWVWDIVFGCFVACGSIILLIALLTYIGLIQGIACSPPDPDDKCDTTIQAGNWLKAALFFIFAFYWIFMIACMAIFVAGGIAHNDVCRHAVNLNDSPITPIVDDIVAQYLPEGSDNVSAIYTSCGNNMAVYTAIGADQIPGLDITELLDLTALEEEIEKIKDINVQLEDITLLSNDAALVMRASQAAYDVFLADVVAYRSELDKNILSEDISSIIEDLTTLENDFSIGLDPALDAYNDVLQTVTSMSTPVGNMNNLFDANAEIFSKANLSVAVDQLDAGEDYFNNNGDAEIEKFLGTTGDGVYLDFSSLTNYIELSVRNNVSRCYPAYDSLVSIIDSTCVDVAYPVNGLWLAIGYTLILYIPAIFIMFRLVNLYSVYIGPEDDDDQVSDAGFEDDYAKMIAASNEKQFNTNHGETTEMTPMNNPIFISDEGLRNGYQNGYPPSYPPGGHAIPPGGQAYPPGGLVAQLYPGLPAADQSARSQPTLPVVRYTSLDGHENQAYRDVDDLPPYRSRDDDRLSYGDDFGSQNFINESLARADRPSRDAEEEQKNKRNSALRLGVQVFPMAQEPARYGHYNIPRPNHSTQI